MDKICNVRVLHLHAPKVNLTLISKSPTIRGEKISCARSAGLVLYDVTRLVWVVKSSLEIGLDETY